MIRFAEITRDFPGNPGRNLTICCWITAAARARSRPDDTIKTPTDAVSGAFLVHYPGRLLPAASR
jgi:hypothetical protein